MTTGLEGVELKLVNSVDEAQNFISWLGERRPHNAIAIDTETGELPGNPRKDALSPWHGRLRLVQVGDAMTGWSIPWDDWKGVFYESMEKFDGPLVCHNVAFEAKWFDMQSSWSIPWHRAHDTMIMGQILDPLGSGALKKLTQQYIDPQAANLQRVLDDGLIDNGWTWGSVPLDFEPYWAYGALDPVLTMRLWEKFWPKFCPGADYSQAYELEMNTRRIVTRMELNGARVDLDYSQKKHDELVGYTEDVRSWAKSTYNGLAIGSNQQLVAQLEELGAEITARTETGQKSASADQLKLLVIHGTPEVQQLAETTLKYRKAGKLASTYFSNFLENNVNGFVHPSVKTMGARTGRMSIQNPALQTLPKGDDTVRRAFLPKDDDHVIITSDLDQVEFRMFASLSQDENLINLFLNADATGSDPFTEIGREIYQDPSMQKSDKRRALIKGVVYGRLYGAGVAKQALTAGVPEDQMRAVSNEFDVRFPGMQEFQKAVEERGLSRLKTEGQGYVTTWTHRRLPCDDDRVYTLVNYLIQGGAAEVFKSNLVKLDQADLTELLIVPVHDEIVLNAPRSQALEIQQIVKECMTTTEGWKVPLTADVDGPLEHWGAKYA
jgi:DNA polymerase-1|tara:strand:+ start:697 stop:2520 length:1824 start_codon:yes stop_codon:yes gene_type:complete